MTLFTVSSIVGDLANAVGATKWSEAFVYAIFIGFIAYAVVRYMLPVQAKGPIVAEHFQPFAPFDADDKYFLPRRRDVDTILAAIHDASRVLLIVGHSGTGKSILLRREVEPILSPHYDFLRISNYESLKTDLSNAERSIRSSHRPTILVLDQFEQALGLASTKNLAADLDIISRQITELIQDSRSTKLIIVIRPEWYYDLRLFLTVPTSELTELYLSGPRPAADSDTFDTMETRLTGVVPAVVARRVVADLTTDNELSPVAYQIIGAVLEDRHPTALEPGVPWYENEIGGINGAIAYYCKRLVEGSVDPRVATKILLALSTQSHFRVSVYKDKLKYLHEEKATVQKCLAYLIEQRVISEPNTYSVSLAHDYLAAVFHGITSDHISPRERDNVLFNFDPGRQSSPSLKEHVKKNTKPTLGDLGVPELACLVLTTALICIRLFAPGRIPWLNISRVHPVYNRFQVLPHLDAGYLFIALVQFCWAIYVVLVSGRLLSRLNEGVRGRALSSAVLGAVVVGALGGAVFPEGWVVSIALVGCTLGLKLWIYGKFGGISDVSAGEVAGIGRRTFFNLLIISAIGLYASGYWYQHLHARSWQHVFDAQTAAGALILCYGVVFLAPVHASRRASAEMLGLIDRMDAPLRTGGSGWT